VKRALLTLALLVGACNFQDSSKSEQADFGHKPKDERALLACLRKYDLLSKCLVMGPPMEMKGVWHTGSEESGFVPNVDSVSLIRERPDKLENVGPEWKTVLESHDSTALLHQLGLVQSDPCPRAIEIKFIGRRAAVPFAKSEFGDEVVVVDKLQSGRLIGRVRTHGLAGYDQECASPEQEATKN
jgi:hypothetical protein